MSLKVFKADEATADYENDFFREFSSNLVQMFEEDGLDGILFGHPEVPANKYLKPDCVLITKNRMVLIDFKNHGGKFWLPDENSFENASWRHDNITIEGGRSINPFVQLKKQRNWAEELIGAEHYGKAGIACIVCFQQDMKTMNSVPGKYQRWFSVTNKYQYLNRIRDVIGIKNQNCADINRISSYFKAKPYNDYYPVSLADVETASVANERLAIAEIKEAEAQEKISKLEREIAKAESEKRNVEKLSKSLLEAKKEAIEIKRIVEKEKKEFDDKKYNLELETQRAIRAKEEADKAKTEIKIAEQKLEREKVKSKTKIYLIVALAAIVLIIIFTIIVLRIDEQNRIAQQESEQLSQLENDYKNGRKCIPVERVADFVEHKNVCVDFYANYINDSKYYVFIDNAKNGTFALMISKQLISKEDAISKYLNKHLEARGSIIKYEDTYEIIINDLSQITIK